MITTPADPLKAIRENIARVKGYTRRGESLRALDLLADTLLDYIRYTIVGNSRFELEISFNEALTEVSRLPDVLPRLPRGANNQQEALRFVRDKEAIMATKIWSITKSIRDEAEKAERLQEQQIEERRANLINAGQICLERGDTVRARVNFTRCADEFGHEPGLITELATRFKKFELYQEAADMFNRAVEAFPRESANYTQLIDCLLRLQEFAKVEKVYGQVARQFGLHPRTLYNMARFYVMWRKKDHAAEAAYRALKIDPNFAEARALLNKLDGIK